MVLSAHFAPWRIIVYRVGQGEAVCLPSDGLAHTVSIATLQLRADFEYVCVPRKSTTVFTQARITNTSEHDMLPGPISVFMDDSFVARTTLQVSLIRVGV